jgi:Tfp pilus assembly protein PilF
MTEQAHTAQALTAQTTVDQPATDQAPAETGPAEAEALDTARPDRKSNRNICLALAALTAIIYCRVAVSGFIPFDDPNYIQDFPRVWSGLTLDNIRWTLTTDYFSNWLPLTWLSYMLDCQLFGPNPGWLHFVNLVYHVANSVLLYLVLARMTKAYRPSAFVAFMFALHPLHVESVAWVSERKDVLSTLFWILCMGAYTGYSRAPSFGRYSLVALTLALGLMAKAMLVTLPCVLLLLDYWPLERFAAAAATGRGKFRTALVLFAEKLPLFALSAFTAWMTAKAQAANGAVSDLGAVSLLTRVANSSLSYAEYLSKTFWPTKLSAYYPHPAYSPQTYAPTPRFYELGAYSAAMLILVSIAVLWFGRRGKYLTVGWLWFVGTLVPVIGLVQVGLQGMADRYTYVPLIGIFIMVGWGVPALCRKLPARQFVLDLACVSSIIACFALTWMQVGRWRNGVTLFTHTLAVTENNVRGRTLLALSQSKLGLFADAAENFREALKLDPNNARTLNHYGVTLMGLNKFEESIVEYRKSIALNPYLASTRFNIGLALKEVGKSDEAIEQLKTAIQLEPEMAKAHHNLGLVLAQQKRFEEAATHYTEALRINPWQKGARENLALAQAERPAVE